MRPKKLPSSHYKQRILEVVKNAELPLDVESTRRRAALGNWESTKSLLLELALEGKVKAFRTGKGWIFFPRIPEPAPIPM